MNILPPCLCNRPQKSTWLKLQCSNCLGVLKDLQNMNYSSQTSLHVSSQDSFSNSLFDYLSITNKSIHKRSCTDKNPQVFPISAKSQDKPKHFLRNPSGPLLIHKANHLSDPVCLFKKQEYFKKECAFLGHKNSVNAIALIDNKIWTGGQDYAVKSWEMPCLDHGLSRFSTRACGFSHSAHKRSITGLAVLNDEHLLTSSLDKSVKIWKMSKGLSSSYSFLHSSGIKSLGVLGSFFVSGTSDCCLHLWDAANCMQTLSYSEHLKPTSSISCFKANTFLTGSEDGTVKLWDCRTAHSISGFSAHKDAVTCIKVHDQHSFTSSSKDKNIKTWDIRSFAELDCIETGQEVNCIDGEKDFLFAAGEKLQAWHKGVLVDEQVTRAKCLKSISHNKTVVIGSYDNTVSIYKLAL